MQRSAENLLECAGKAIVRSWSTMLCADTISTHKKVSMDSAEQSKEPQTTDLYIITAANIGIEDATLF